MPVGYLFASSKVKQGSKHVHVQTFKLQLPLLFSQGGGEMGFNATLLYVAKECLYHSHTLGMVAQYHRFWRNSPKVKTEEEVKRAFSEKLIYIYLLTTLTLVIWVQ